VDASTLPTDLTDPQPQPASWVRVTKKGSISFSNLVAGEVPLVGWFEVPIQATNFDVIIDFGEANYPIDGYVEVVPTLQGMPGTGIAQLGEFHIYPGTGVSSSDVFIPGSCTCVQGGALAAKQFLLHAGSNAALVWGLRIAYVGFTFGEQVTNLVVTAIAHGREIG
jgi:hypothetical protein